MEKIDYTKFALSKDDIIWEIRNKCLKEMYAKAQPSANYNNILNRYKECKALGLEPEKVYEHHYLSQEEFTYILEKYLDLYNLKETFKDDCDIIIRDMEEGCYKDKYISERTDDNGNEHPGYRSSERVPKLSELIGNEHAQFVINYIKERKNFYRFNVDECKFRFSVALIDSPTSNPEAVIKYWKSKGVNLEIDPRHKDSDYFWSEENGYLEEDEEE